MCARWSECIGNDCHCRSEGLEIKNPRLKAAFGGASDVDIASDDVAAGVETGLPIIIIELVGA